MIALVKNDEHCTMLCCVGAVMTAPYDGAVQMWNRADYFLRVLKSSSMDFFQAALMGLQALALQTASLTAS